jgi:primosomal protein N'
MITTGFDFEKIGLIGVILLEQELCHPSFDASEKAYANLKQLIGRGNRKSQETTIILQTFLAKNPLVKRLIEGNYKEFFTQTLQERKEFLYPPYKEILTLEYRHQESKKALDFTQKLEQKILELPLSENFRILRGSTTFKKNNTFHAKIMLQGENLRTFITPLKKEIL